MVIDYALKWVEAQVWHTNIANVTTRFIYECILHKFQYPIVQVSYKYRGAFHSLCNQTFDKSLYIETC